LGAKGNKQIPFENDSKKNNGKSKRENEGERNGMGLRGCRAFVVSHPCHDKTVTRMGHPDLSEMLVERVSARSIPWNGQMRMGIRT